MKKFINKLPLRMIIVMISFFSCEQEDHRLLELQGTVRFGGISLEFAPMGSPRSRIAGNSTWEHIFPNSADLVFENIGTGQRYTLAFNPNDFSVPYSITLPFGAYTYYSVVEGDVFSEYLPFEVAGELLLDSQSMEISLEAKTDYGLITVKNKYVENASVTDGDTTSELAPCEDDTYWYMYVKGEIDVTLMIKESFQGSTIVRELAILANRHYNYLLTLAEGTASIKELIIAVFELEEEEILLGSGTLFFEENGIIKCPGAAPGDKGLVNEKIYEAVDRKLLIRRRDENADLTCVCTSLVTDMSRMFAHPKPFPLFNQPIGNWDVSNVLDMSYMFFRDTSFNQPISDWDVSNVTTMEFMFAGTLFNQPIGYWDVGNVTNMGLMFGNSEKFNQPIGDWDVSNVTNMGSMFNATLFNQPIGDWDVGKVTDMNYMFYENHTFNQPIGDWNVNNVTDMSYMFRLAESFNQAIGDWDVGNVREMSYMFAQARNFNQFIGDWDLENVWEMSNMFEGAESFNQPIGDWNVGNVRNMRIMFSRAKSFNQPIGDWDVSNVTTMEFMFADTPFNQPIGNWNVSNVTAMTYMFYNTPFNQPIGDWNVGNVTNMVAMFHNASRFNQPIGYWDVSNVTNMGFMFDNAEKFNQPIGDWDIGNVRVLVSMFKDAKLFNQKLNNWCVPSFRFEDTDFSTGSALINANKPKWGTCPDR